MHTWKLCPICESQRYRAMGGLKSNGCRATCNRRKTRDGVAMMVLHANPACKPPAQESSSGMEERRTSAQMPSECGRRRPPCPCALPPISLSATAHAIRRVKCQERQSTRSKRGQNVCQVPKACLYALVHQARSDCLVTLARMLCRGPTLRRRSIWCSQFSRCCDFSRCIWSLRL